ncbi:MAG: DUF5671 domain-containing protein [Candidatus Zambryskibacteria bacterium]
MFASVGIILVILIIIIMGNNKTSAKDFFLHLGVIVSLYAIVISFLNLAFKIINKAFPEVAQNIYAWGAGSEISMPVATLIIVFPLFAVLSHFAYKAYVGSLDKQEPWIRKWLIYVTLFVAGVTLVGDLITVLYKFLDGQDLTAAFLLKALVVFLVAGAVFGFYLQDIREKISSGKRKMWLIATGIIVLVFIILGFSVLGSPQTQRLLRYDNQKITDLQNIQWQVISYWQMNGTIPASLGEITNNQSYVVIPKDPQSKVSYEYKGTGNMTFELCAEFNKESMVSQNVEAIPLGYAKGSIIQNENWNHKAGHQCFSRIIDPVVYPTQVRG